MLLIIILLFTLHYICQILIGGLPHSPTDADDGYCRQSQILMRVCVLYFNRFRNAIFKLCTNILTMGFKNGTSIY